MARSLEMTGANVDEAVEKALAELALDRNQVDVEVLEEGEAGGFLGFGRKPARIVVTVKETEEDAFDDEEDAFDDDGEVFDDEDANEEAYDVEENEDEAEVEAPIKRQDRPARTERRDDDNAEDSDAPELDPEAIVEKVTAFLVQIQENMHLSNDVTAYFEGQKLFVNIDGDDCGILIGRRGDTLRSLQYITSLYVNRLAGTRVEMRMDIGNYKNKRENSVSDLAIRTAQKALRTGNAYELNPMGSNDRRIVHETLADFKGIVTYSEGDEPQRYVVIDLAEAMDPDAMKDEEISYDGDDNIE